MVIDQISYGKLIDNLHDGLYIVDCNRMIQQWNKAAEKITGYRAAEVIGKSCADNILTHVDMAGNSLCLGMCPLAATMVDRESREAEVFLHHKNGHRVPVSVRTSTLTNKNGVVIGGVELFTDISNHAHIKERVKELEEMAMIDKLTRLANRNYIEKEFFIRFEEKNRFAISFGCLFIDIDHFKKFNDTHGHDVGDKVLRFVADTLVGNSRPFDVIGRWGGEEFIGIIRNVNAEQLESIGNRLRKLVETAYLQVEEKKLQVCISIGATLVTEDDNIDSLIKRADTLLYQSKAAGRNCLTLG